MNSTNFEHAAWAVAIQVFWWLITKDWWIGAAAGAYFFAGREHAQAQSKLKCGDLAAWDFRSWSLDARLDLACPAVAVVVVALAAKLLGF